MRVRIPSWTTGATISVNGTPQDLTITPGSYATLTRTWTSGDTVTVRLPMRVVMRAANDNANVVGGHLRAGGAVGKLRQQRAVVAAGPEHLLDHPHQWHDPRLHRHRQRLHRQPGPVLRRAQPELHRLLERRWPERTTPTAWST